MEGYNDDDYRIYQAWVDGVTDEASGSQVGYDASPFAEKAVVHGGKQSMPFMYDNTASPYVSEATREFETAQNWTGNGASEICIWTRGYPAVTTTAVTETGGKMTLTGAGADIWGTSDECTYACKTLTGDGTIIARVTNTGTGTQTWAKGGVMIRDSINGGAAQAIMAITTPGTNGGQLPVSDDQGRRICHLRQHCGGRRSLLGEDRAGRRELHGLRFSRRQGLEQDRHGAHHDGGPRADRPGRDVAPGRRGPDLPVRGHRHDRHGCRRLAGRCDQRGPVQRCGKHVLDHRGQRGQERHGHQRYGGPSRPTGLAG